MHNSDVLQLLKEAFHEADVYLNGSGCDFQVTVITDDFTDLSAVKRQQLVYRCLNDLISEGTIHAVTMQTLTHAEWIQKNKK